MATEQAIGQRAPTIRWKRIVSSPSAKPVAAGLAITVFATAIWIVGGFNAIRSAYVYLRGETILVDSNTKSFGVVSPGDPISVSFTLTNTGAAPVRIAGCEAWCNCVVPKDMPFVLEPNESRDFPVSIRNPKREGAVPKGYVGLDLKLFTTNPAQPRIGLTVKGEIRNPSVSPAVNP